MSTATRSILRYSDDLGRRFVEFVKYHVDIYMMVYSSARATFSHEEERRAILSVILSQVYYTGCQAIPLVTALGLAVGSIIILNASALSFLGDISMIANLLIVVVVRELGPLVVALILIARSGTAIAAEIGNMKVNGEIDALKSMGIDPLSYIIFPRLAGGIIGIICLTFYFNAIALIGGFMVTKMFHDFPFSLYSDALSEAMSVHDVSFFLFKNILNGITIFSISCYYGMKVGSSSHEVPQATTKAVIASISAVATTTVFATAAFYLGQLFTAATQ